LEDLSHAELKHLVVVSLFEQIAELWRTAATQADEIGGPQTVSGPLNIKPSGDRSRSRISVDKIGRGSANNPSAGDPGRQI
jgi:hypothetical protein